MALLCRFVIALVIIPLAGAASAFLFTPVRASSDSLWIWVADLGRLPEDGTPVRTAVTQHQRDVWTWQSERTLGYIFLRRVPETGDVVALSEITQYGTRVKYDCSGRRFEDPCRLDWHFDLDGKCLPDPGRSDLQKSEVQVRDGSVYIVHKHWGD